MNLRPLLVSMTLFAILAVAAYLVLRGPDEEAPPPFFALARQTPDTLTVVRPPDTTVVVPGGRTGWRLVAPVEDVADGLVVDALVERLRDLPVTRRFPLDPERMGTYGLANPRGVIRAAYRDGAPPDTLVVGAFTMDGRQDYVRAGSGDEVGLLETRVTRNYLFKRTLELRDTRLFPFHESRATWFQGRDGDGAVVSEARRDSSGAWFIVSGYAGPADTREVDEFLSSVAHMHIDSFAAEQRPPPSETGLDRPRASFRVAVETGDTLWAALGDPLSGQELMLAARGGRPQLLRVSTKYLPVFLADPDRYRDPVVIPFGLGDVDSVEADFGPGASRAWTAEAWKAVDNPGPALRAALEAWILARGEAFLPAAPEHLARLGLDSPRATLRWRNGDRLLASVDIGSGQGGLVAVRRATGTRSRPDEILLVPAASVGPALEFLSGGRLKLQSRN